MAASVYYAHSRDPTLLQFYMTAIIYKVHDSTVYTLCTDAVHCYCLVMKNILQHLQNVYAN